VQNFTKPSAAVLELGYQQRTRFQTTVDFDREYLWNGSSNRQAENGVIWTTIFPHSTQLAW